jgi:hypothetical protein
MTDYDPRTATGIPTEPVGSLPRPAKLQAAYAAHDEGKIDLAALEAEQEEAVKDSIERFEATGSPIISDGEQRWSSFATYPITDTLNGTGLADNLGLGASSSRSSPTATDGSCPASPVGPCGTSTTRPTRCGNRSNTRPCP